MDTCNLAEMAGNITHLHSYMGWMKLAPATLITHYLEPAEAGKFRGAMMVTGGKGVVITYDGEQIILNGQADRVLNVGAARFAWIWGEGPDPECREVVLVPLDEELASLMITPTQFIGLKELPVAAIRFMEHRLPVAHAIRLRLQQVQEIHLKYQYVLTMALIDHSEKVLDSTIRHTLSRMFQGQRLSDMQVVRHRLAGLHAALELARAYGRATIVGWEEGSYDISRIKRTKRHIYQTAAELADKCLQLFGGRGFMAGNWNTQAFCDTLTYGIFIDEV